MPASVLRSENHLRIVRFMARVLARFGARDNGGNFLCCVCSIVQYSDTLFFSQEDTCGILSADAMVCLCC